MERAMGTVLVNHENISYMTMCLTLSSRELLGDRIQKSLNNNVFLMTRLY